MRKFVKYENRKIHEIGSSEHYVTMDGLADIVARGEDVEIIDDQTGKDVTSTMLARLVYDASRSERWDEAFAAEHLTGELRKLLRHQPGPARVKPLPRRPRKPSTKTKTIKRKAAA